MRAAVLGEQIAGEVVAPVEQRHLQLELRLHRVGADYDMVRSPVFVVGGEHDAEVLVQLAEPEPRRIQEMRAQVVQHTGAVIAPWLTLGLRGGDVVGPTIEHSVSIGTGAKVLGRVRVGAGAQIGANAIVLEDVAPGSTVVGVPARPAGLD